MDGKEKIKLEDAHILLLYLLIYFEKACEKADIPWYASGGTCLGAVRHKGFIPWDDDIDIDMPREYYSRFVQACEDILPASIVLHTRESDPYFCQEYIKMCYRDEDKGYSDLSLDVFFYDETNPKRKIGRALQNFATTNLYYIKEYKVSRMGKGEKYIPHNPLKRCMVALFSHLSLRTLDRCLFGVMTVVKKDYGFWVNWGAAHSYQIATFEKSRLGKPIKLPFEQGNVYAAADTDYVLRKLYGDSYMKMPPENNRKTHDVETIHSSLIDMDKIRNYVNDLKNWPI